MFNIFWQNCNNISAEYIVSFFRVKDKSKDKAIPLQAWTGSGGSRRLRLPDLKTIGT
jgi:hypothetical protein